MTARGGFIPVERPPGTIDIEDVAQADYAIERALDYGDYEPLLARLRAGKGLPAEQRLLADIYQKRVNRPPHRMKHPEALHFRNVWLALCVLERRLKGDALKTAVADTVRDTRVKTSTVYAAVKGHHDLFRRCGFPSK
jgi:hypothetical protein